MYAFRMLFAASFPVAANGRPGRDCAHSRPAVVRGHLAAAPKQGRRTAACLSAAGPGPELGPDEEVFAVTSQRVDDASHVLEEMLKEVTHDLMVAAAVSEITGDPPELTQRQAVRAAVDARIETLEEPFLAALGAHLAAARSAGDGSLATMLSDIREEVLGAVNARLPEQIQTLDALVRLDSPKARRAKLASLMEAERDRRPGPQALAMSVLLSATQLIEDMESSPYVPDRRLLARVCSVREEARSAAGGEWAGDGALRPNLPTTELEFLRRLMPQMNSALRLEELRMAFVDDNLRIDPPEPVRRRKGGAAASEPGSLGPVEERLKQSARKGKGGEEEEMDAAAKEEATRAYRYVRPGRMMDVLAATMIELEKRGQAVEPQRKRVFDIYTEARRVLCEVSGDVDPGAPAGSSGVRGGKGPAPDVPIIAADWTGEKP